MRKLSPWDKQICKAEKSTRVCGEQGARNNQKQSSQTLKLPLLMRDSPICI